MADTIALRNIALLGLVLCLVWQYPNIRHHAGWGWPLICWLGYLLLFPLISDDHVLAWKSFEGQWGRGLLAMVSGAGVASIFFNRGKGSAFSLGLVSAVPILVHLAMFAWQGWTTSSIPWGYWGRETHHADLGYAAGQAMLLVSAAMAARGGRLRVLLGLPLLLACILSTTLANSRAGMVFGLIALALVFGVAALMQAEQRILKLSVFIIGIVVIGSASFAIAAKYNGRWHHMVGAMEAGFKGDAIRLQCEGTSSIEPEIRADAGKEATSIIGSVQGQDGARVVLMRAGWALALLHPWGSDGSRHAFQTLLRQECADPVISMAHTHNGWLDTMLALGWLGAASYLSVLLYFFHLGFSFLRREKILNEWALVLVALSTFWILRGFTDSVFRDHMLEMQGFVLAYAMVSLKLQTQGKLPSTATQSAPRPTRKSR